MYETTGIIDEQLLRALGKHLLPPKQRLVFAVLCPLALLLGILNAWMDDGRAAWFFLLLLAVLVIERVFIQRKIIRTNLVRLRETTGESSVRYTTRLEAAGVQIRNHATGASGTIPYEHFVRLVETPFADVLFTKAWQFVPLFRSGGQREARLAFLREKPTKIKHL